MGLIIRTALRKTLNLAIATGGLILVFYTISDFTSFLRGFPSRIPQTSNDTEWVSWSLFINMCLIIAFILQHSLMALPRAKQLFSAIGLEVARRSIYVIATSLALQLLIRYWKPIPQVALWKLDIEDRTVTSWLFFTAHFVAWAVIYTGAIYMDITELLGLKQVYYDLKSLQPPQLYRSQELNRLYGHIRHPSFTCFLVIFWVIPFMSLDRILLAAICSLYMYTAWNTDPSDLEYQEYQYIRKKYELQHMQLQ